MAWRIDFVRSAAKELEELDAEIQRRIIRFLRERIEPAPREGRNMNMRGGIRRRAPDPRRIGKALRGGKVPLWAYRVGDWRIICAIEDKEKRVLVLRVGHRRSVYD